MSLEHPEPKPTRVGWLNENGSCRVLYGWFIKSRHRCISIEDLILDESVVLNANEALSLLAWLKQEQDTLLRLAKEQET